MKNLFLPLFIFVSYIANAQYVTLLDSNAVWRQGTKSCTNNGLTAECGAWDYFNFQLNNGDTVINGNTYRKVNDYYYDDFNTLPYAYLREDSGRVYMKYDAEIYTPLYSPSLHSTAYISDTTEFVLYDFTLQVGDTFTTRIYKCGLSFFINEGDSITYNQPFVLVSIDTVTFNNSALRKKYSLEPIINWNSNQYFGPDLEWIEGIGSIGTFFYNELNFMSGCGGDFGFRNFAIACYTLNDTILWGVENCILPTAVNENIAKENTKVFPNPVEDLLTIKSPINYTNYAVYNTLGSVVQSGTISTNSIDFSALSNGIYILSLIDKNTRHYRAIITK
jgi:Secretion system C-terminal sorting domain